MDGIVKTTAPIPKALFPNDQRLVVKCKAWMCPVLIPPYEAVRLDSMLFTVGRTFLLRTIRVSLDTEMDEVVLGLVENVAPPLQERSNSFKELKHILDSVLSCRSVVPIAGWNLTSGLLEFFIFLGERNTMFGIKIKIPEDTDG
ncbi:hypothetical protein AVEN_143888-1 [Araneus ventricosus]|uniref:Uncharacterized protein n=1 Tax=Araneus ventricosus TaxID=182803 RepID=A0A4Y2D9E3_ARAVE|nr:hypothetical protein AVEN_143888-1 [Araneus ventricosus]